MALQRIAGAALALTLFAPVAAYADAAQDAAVKELIEVGKLDNMLPGLAQQATGSAVPLLQEYFVKNKISLSPEQQKKVQDGLKDYVAKQNKLASDYFSSAAVKAQWQGEMSKAYSAQFSADELKQIVAFYKTPAGQKLMQHQGSVLGSVEGEMMKAADKSLLAKMQATAADYGKTFAKK